MAKKIWDCKIGEVDGNELLDGADAPMRQAIKKAYREVTGSEPDFVFSGWGGELTENERAVVEDRPPTQNMQGEVLFEGRTIRWHRFPKFVTLYFDFINSLNIQAEPTEANIAIAMTAYDQGTRHGQHIGRSALKHDLCHLIGAATR